MEQGESAAPGAASAARAGVRISFAGRSGPAVQAVRTPQRIAAWPLDAYSLAVACGGRGVSRRHLSRQPFGTPAIVRRPVQGHDIGSLRRRRARPRATACRPLHARRSRRARAVSARRSSNGRWEVAPDSRATATWRSVPLRRVDRAAARLRRGTLDTFRCRHNARRFVRRRPREAASGCGATYHAGHYARINRVLSRPLAAAGLDAGLAPRHYRIATKPSGSPRRRCDAVQRLR